jgi:predicted nuclease with TOPRIM domain
MGNLRSELAAQAAEVTGLKGLETALRNELGLSNALKDDCEKIIEDLQVREKKLKVNYLLNSFVFLTIETTFFFYQKKVMLKKNMKNKEDPSVEGELSFELKLRGETLRKVTEDFEALQKDNVVLIERSTRLESLLHKSNMQLIECQSTCNDARERCVVAEALAGSLRCRFDEYKQRTTTFLTRVPEHLTTESVHQNVLTEADEASYRSKTAEALRLANESVAKYRAQCIRNRLDDEAQHSRLEELTDQLTIARTAAEIERTRSGACIAELEVLMKESASIRQALDRVSSQLEEAVLRASNAEKDGRRWKEKTEELTGSVAVMNADLSRLERELKQKTHASTFLLEPAMNDKLENCECLYVPVPIANQEASKDDEPATSLILPENRKLIFRLQTELAETTLKLGDIQEKVSNLSDFTK